MSSGCIATVETLDGSQHRISSDAFRAYAEAVFREQNRVASALVFRMEDEQLDPAAHERLADVEARLLDACRALNEVAVRRRDDEGRRLFADARAAKTVPDCERAVVSAREMLAD